MSLISALALYFIIWWITLFAVLPFGVRTQADDKDVAPGTVESAPSRFRAKRTVAWTTIVSAVIFGTYYVVAEIAGYGLDSLPQIVPDFADD